MTPATNTRGGSWPAHNPKPFGGRQLHPDGWHQSSMPVAAVAVEPFAPEAARKIAAGRPENGWHWGVFVAFNGTTLAILDPPRMEATE